MDEYISSLQKENNQLKIKHNNLKQTILNKDNYISQYKKIKRLIDLNSPLLNEPKKKKKFYKMFQQVIYMIMIIMKEFYQQTEISIIK